MGKHHGVIGATRFAEDSTGELPGCSSPNFRPYPRAAPPDADDQRRVSDILLSKLDPYI